MKPATRSSFLYDRLAQTLSQMIEQGVLRPGERLPSVRTLSRRRGVSISTVLQAYRLLEDRGLLEARPQSGYYVRLKERPTEPRCSAPPLQPQAVSVGGLVGEVMESVSHPDIVPLGAAVPDAALLPTTQLNQLLARTVRQTEAASSTYQLPLGFAPLRREIARRSLEEDKALVPDEILITAGCLEALSLCLRAVAKAGDTIAVESPAYFGQLQLIESLDMRALEIPTHPRTGIDLGALAAALAEQSVAACVVSPSFQNPFGSRMPEANKERLVGLMRTHNRPLIEDDLYGDLFFAPPRPKTLLAYDPEGTTVLYCNSFSKSLAPGYRVGWVVPGRWMAAVKRIKYATTIATAGPPQLALAAYLAKGGYDRHLRRLRRIFADNLDRLAQAVGNHFPEGTRVTRPQGGFVLWVELPETVDALALYRTALLEGISIAPGPIFSATGQYQHCIRLSGGYAWSERIASAVARIGTLAKMAPRTQAA